MAYSVISTDFVQSSSDVEASVTGTKNFIQKLRISTEGSIHAGTYRIGVQYNWRYTDTTRDFKARVQVDDTTTVWVHTEEPYKAEVDEEYSASGFAYIVFASAGSHDIDLDYGTDIESATAYIKNARLEFWRVA